jgi:hypothetical protein
MKNALLNFSIARLYKKSPQDSSMGIWVLILIVIALFVLLQFRSPLLLIPFIRDAKIEKLITDTVHNKELDVQQLWQLRDQLGAKVTYNPDYLEPHSIFQLKEIPEKDVQLFQYSGNGVVSTEYLVTSYEIRPPIRYPGEPVLMAGSLLIYYDSIDQKVYIRTEQTFDSMKKNNGMVDYRELEQDLSRKVWVIETVFDVSPNFRFKEV